jgi:hypothetical protein
MKINKEKKTKTAKASKTEKRWHGMASAMLAKQ